VIARRNGGEERWNVCGCVGCIVLLVDVAKTNLVFIGQVYIKAVDGRVGVVECSCAKSYIAYVNRSKGGSAYFNATSSCGAFLSAIAIRIVCC
jgi:hypothetical protein